MKIPAFKKNSKDDEVTWVDVQKDLLIITIVSGDLVIETEDGTFVLPNSLDEWAAILEPYGFEKSDRNCIVKLDRIVHHDEEVRLVYFGEDSDNKRLAATVSNKRWRKFKRFLRIRRQED